MDWVLDLRESRWKKNWKKTKECGTFPFITQANPLEILFPCVNGKHHRNLDVLLNKLCGSFQGNTCCVFKNRSQK